MMMMTMVVVVVVVVVVTLATQSITFICQSMQINT